jgi:uncharacterized membrane protein
MKVLLCEYLYSFATDFAKLSKMWANVHQMNSAIVEIHGIPLWLDTSSYC